MSLFYHDHSDEGFDEEWAKSMQPAWDKCDAERAERQAKWDALTPAEQELAARQHIEYMHTHLNNALSRAINPEPTEQPSKTAQLDAIAKLNTFLKDTE